MAQSVGYLIASAGPFAMGALHGIIGSWTLPLVVLLVVAGADAADRDRLGGASTGTCSAGTIGRLDLDEIARRIDAPAPRDLLEARRSCPAVGALVALDTRVGALQRHRAGVVADRADRVDVVLR